MLLQLMLNEQLLEDALLGICDDGGLVASHHETHIHPSTSRKAFSVPIA